MIYHDRCTFVVQKKNAEGDWEDVTGATFPDQPCELSPINSEPADSSGPINTRYRLVTPVYLPALFAGIPVGTGLRLRIDYHGEALQVEGGYERHMLLGRFHHIEAIVQDFGLL